MAGTRELELAASAVTVSDVKISCKEHHSRSRSGTMPRSNPLLWPRPPAIWCYGIAVFLVAAALVISHWPPLHLQAAPTSLFLCAVMISAWLGGVGPGLLAVVLSCLAFNYYFLQPLNSFTVE